MVERKGTSPRIITVVNNVPTSRHSEHHHYNAQTRERERERRAVGQSRGRRGRKRAERESRSEAGVSTHVAAYRRDGDECREFTQQHAKSTMNANTIQIYTYIHSITYCTFTRTKTARIIGSNGSFGRKL